MRLHGEDLRALDVLELRRRACLVPQLPALLPGTVEENVGYGPALRGRAADTGCGSKRVRVRITVRGVRGGKAWHSRVTGGNPRFTLTPRVKLRPGRYTVVVRAVDAAGNATQVRRTARVR